MKPLFEVGQWVRCVDPFAPCDRTQVLSISDASEHTIALASRASGKLIRPAPGNWYSLSHLRPDERAHEIYLRHIGDQHEPCEEEFAEELKNIMKREAEKAAA